MSNRCIYQPKGAAKEYGAWACNLYNGCSHHCDYCYCKRGVWVNTMGIDKPELKAMLGKDENEAYLIFARELKQHRDKILAAGDGLFSRSLPTRCFVRKSTSPCAASRSA